MESSCLVGVEFSFHKTERIWRRVVEMEARALPPPTCARKHGYGGNFYMVFFFFCHDFKNWRKNKAVRLEILQLFCL